jgi:hypothetical protein
MHSRGYGLEVVTHLRRRVAALVPQPVPPIVMHSMGYGLEVVTHLRRRVVAARVLALVRPLRRVRSEVPADVGEVPRAVVAVAPAAVVAVVRPRGGTRGRHPDKARRVRPDHHPDAVRVVRRQRGGGARGLLPRARRAAAPRLL